MTEESDALWQVYSKVKIDGVSGRNEFPNEEGVHVRSTIGKLAGSLADWTRSHPSRFAAVGRVRYGTREWVQRAIGQMIDHYGLTAAGQGEGRASMLLVKRAAFEHESEVRLIALDDDVPASEPFLNVPIDPSVLFEEVSFDPRLISSERERRRADLKAAGYTGPFGESGLYQRTLLEIPFENGWKD